MTDLVVIPAKAGIQGAEKTDPASLDSRFSRE